MMPLKIVALVMTVCINGVCRDEHVEFIQRDFTLQMCQVRAPIMVAEVLLEHPGWIIERWRCVDGV